ncbi:hypothetical protein [Blastococcus brunescens]|uniref:Uncharacterized protein n=1 Tax=Blastococcus brunescens TaxID=1564165 RepID=A0ABZ1B2L1_9ACTN|nr:hypothetical protein [Blastococcus sp. BMG 8361]WRL64607.1 hypothetical protein U6N30_02050 [Blastococcus sp. BMG 8361]
MDRMPPEPPATLAGWLRTRSDEQLSALLAARPDVARPAPSDLVALASRLAVPVSVDRALDELDAATLQVLDVVLLAPTDGMAPDALFAALPDVPDDVLAAGLERLTTRALLWGTTSCTRRTPCGGPSATRQVSAAGPPNCGCSCPPTWPPRSPGWSPRSARSWIGSPPSGRWATCPTPRGRDDPGPPAPAARSAGPHRRPERGTAPGDRAAPAR